MKLLIILCVCFFAFPMLAKSQVNPYPSSDTIKVVLENEKLKVTEYTSTPGKDVCGKGQHTHPAHLTILLTDVSVQLTTQEGEVKHFDVPSGTTFWSEEEMHVVRNSGGKGARVLLVEVK